MRNITLDELKLILDKHRLWLNNNNEGDRADLRYANLRSADLRYANLSSANLSSADLRSADLSSADLSSAKGVNKYKVNPYYILQDQPGNIRAYKLVNASNEGPFNGGIRYDIGQTYEILNANTDEQTECAAGINVASLDWCLKNYEAGYKILLIEFTAKDIAAIPVSSDGKFRLFRCKVIKELGLLNYGIEVTP
jgi:hypothetical protein